MRIANVLAGFSLAEADVLRKAVGKKDAELIRKELGKFVERAHGPGPPEEAGGRAGRADRDLRPLRLQQVALGGLLGPVATRPPGSRRTTRPSSWRRCSRRKSATPTRWCSTSTRPASWTSRCCRPDVNESGFKFTVVGDRRIRFGLGAVRNVGWGAIESIIAARQGGAATRRWRTSSSGSTSGSATSGCSSRSSRPAPATPSAATGSSSSRRSTTRWRRRSSCQQEREAGQESLFGEATAPRPRRTEPARTCRPGPRPSGWRGKRRCSASSSPGIRWSASATRSSSSAPAPPPRSGEWSEHPVSVGGGGHRGEAADLQEDRQGVRPARARGLPRHGGGDRLPRRLGQAQRDHPARRGAAPLRRVQRPRPGRGPRARSSSSRRGRWRSSRRRAPWR